MTGVALLILAIAALTALAVWLDARWSAPSDYVGIGHRGRVQHEAGCAVELGFNACTCGVAA